ncbi:unnamed protein product [Cylindrotheca closterium]|uniref:Calmodulin n=1 Tax=Cylindrotheca closterium TaxID=2856 RepID=A0AAD2FFT2_9STRA|nr:unnamed protein product [Cylindrotheca closterium]
MGNHSSKKLDKTGRMGIQQNAVQQTNDLDDAYDISEHSIGEGTRTSIKQGTSKKYTKTERSTGVAIKLYNGKAEVQPDLKLEAEILRECDHPNIVKLFEVAKVGKNLSLVMELCSGGPVLDRCPYTEKMASRVVRQICSAVAYLHSKQIVHRDIECSNIMYATEDKNSDIKLVDFGSATFLEMVPGHQGAFKFLHDKTGSMHVMAPEVIKQRYGPKVDVWSIGIVTYMLLQDGQPPIHGTTIDETERKILQGSVDYRGWSHSSLAKEFIQLCCHVNAGQRMGSAEARKHPWIEKTIAKKNLPNELVVSFDLFRLSSPLKRLGLNVLAKKKHASKYSGLWEDLDTSESGTLTRDEFMDGFKHSGSSQEELNDLFVKLDVNCNGEILYTEFLAATLENSGEIQESEIKEAFEVISKNGKYITKKDVLKVVGAKRKRKVDDASLKEEIDFIFEDTDKIDYEGFATLFEHGYTAQIGMDAIMETSLNEEQLSKMKEDDNVTHLSVVKESMTGNFDFDPSEEIRNSFRSGTEE